MNEPNFFVAGVAKSGSTAMFDYLGQHPNIWCPAFKEPNYFATDFPAVRGPKTEAEYAELFADADETHIARGEASIAYFWSRDALPEIRRRYPDARIIIMLRNPVDMIYSFHSQMLNTANEDEPDFIKAWNLQEERQAGRHIPRTCAVPELLQYGEAGRLGKGLKRVLELFPGEQVKVLFTEDMRADPQAVFDQATDFLGVPRYSDVDFKLVNVNRVQKSQKVAQFTERPLAPGVRGLVRGIKKALGLQHVSFKRYIAGMNLKEAPREPLPADFRAKLVAYYADEVTELEHLTGRDLSHWRQ